MRRSTTTFTHETSQQTSRDNPPADVVGPSTPAPDGTLVTWRVIGLPHQSSLLTLPVYHAHARCISPNAQALETFATMFYPTPNTTTQQPRQLSLDVRTIETLDMMKVKANELFETLLQQY